MTKLGVISTDCTPCEACGGSAYSQSLDGRLLCEECAADYLIKTSEQHSMESIRQIVDNIDLEIKNV